MSSLPHNPPAACQLANSGDLVAASKLTIPYMDLTITATSEDHIGVDPTTTQTFDDLIATTLYDHDISDRDSAIGGVSPRHSEESTESLASELRNNCVFNGRTYHSFKEGKYFLPNDEREQDRLDLQHQLFWLTLGKKLYLAPIKTPGQVLDIGTGTGIWAIDFANEHPEAVVTGNDLSPIQPRWVPPNLKFELDDMEDEWPFWHKFDFIHGRMLFSCFENAAKVIRSAYDFLNLDGFLELQDAVLPLRSDDGTLDGTALREWMDLVIECARNLGRDWTTTSQYKRYMLEAGFTDVQEVHYKWPINPWPQETKIKGLGYWCQTDLENGLEAFSMRVLTSSGMLEAEVQAMLVNVRKDIRNRSIHAYIPIVVVYGRKA